MALSEMYLKLFTVYAAYEKACSCVKRNAERMPTSWKSFTLAGKESQECL